MAALREPVLPRWRTEQANPLPINNRTTLHLLEALQILRVKIPGGGGAETRRLSFRALDIEQIGHVYEGLLDHKAVRATEPVLGLKGAKKREPELLLARLEEYISRKDAEAQREKEKENLGGLAAWREPFWKFLKDETGRSESALKNSAAVEPDHPQKGRLRAACGNDEALYQRVLPFAGLIRNDDYGWPVVIQDGSVYVTAGTTRRATGTHYTPRSLTEPIVQHTLEPLVYVGPAEGNPREEWQLQPPKTLLDLKVCDMAMGSGAFLVQACRYLSERLVEAWGEVASGVGTFRETSLQITPEGFPATGDPNEMILPDDEGERLMLARRLVADRCLYGVDNNHLAVEMAKLSLWLITLDKNRPFTFLDHALRHGDSLIGADDDMFLRWAHGLQASSMPLFDAEIRKMVMEAQEKRRALQAFSVRDVRDAEKKARLLAEAEAATARIKLGCDLLVGARLLSDLKKKEQDALLANGLLDYIAGREWGDPAARRAVKAAQALPAFHWHFEFPEVFAQGGFSAFVGNPPFLGGQRISTMTSDGYLSCLRSLYKSAYGTADLCAYFFVGTFNNLRLQGTIGLISTNTISQGDTRTTSLDYISKNSGDIFRAEASKQWPGVAAVYVSIIHFMKGMYQGAKILNNQKVQIISPLLDTISVLGDPKKLMGNSKLSFIGSYVLGAGFILDPTKAKKLSSIYPKNIQVVKPYLGGKELNTEADQSFTRWVINFYDWPLHKAQEYQDCLSIVQELVKPHRDKIKRKRNREKWWLYAENRPGLYSTIANMNQILVKSRVSNTHALAFVPNGWVYSDALVVFAYDTDYSKFLILQSSIHETWVRKYASTLKGDTRYSPSNVFETYPFPQQEKVLKLIGETYYKHRRQLMLERQEGLTKTYNRFHNSQETAQDIVHLRQLHVEMDNAVAAVYGWHSSTGSETALELDHGFHETKQGIRYTISEAARREVLTRLLKLNHERYAEEVAQGLHDKKKKTTRKTASRKKKVKKDDKQLSIF